MPQTTAQQLGLWPYQLYALSLGGPCRLRAGYGERDGELLWLTEADRYHLVVRGQDPWVRSGYPVQVWIHGRLAATILPRRRRTRSGLRSP